MEIETRHKRKCKECDKLFKVSRDWQLFCNKTCRYRYNKRHSNICFYCGNTGSHKHHVDPRAISGKNYFNGVEIVCCCPECNNVLSDNYFELPHESVEFLIDTYIKKYKLLIPAVEWDEEELEELGRNLRQHVKKKLAARRRNEDRILYLKSVRNFMLCDEDL